jgi:hypothetical protein
MAHATLRPPFPGHWCLGTQDRVHIDIREHSYMTGCCPIERGSRSPRSHCKLVRQDIIADVNPTPSIENMMRCELQDIRNTQDWLDWLLRSPWEHITIGGIEQVVRPALQADSAKRRRCCQRELSSDTEREPRTCRKTTRS